MLVGKKRGEKLAIFALALALLIIPLSFGVNESNSTINPINISINETITNNDIIINETVNITPTNITNVTTINETINITPIINETLNNSEGIIGVPEIPSEFPSAIGNITITNKSIKIRLNYNNDSIYDNGNDGIETINGVIDFNVDAEFNWNVNQGNLCTRWKTYSIESQEWATVCYGSQKCCNFIELTNLRDNWNDTFYSTYGQHGATFNNTISAQVIYVDYNLS